MNEVEFLALLQKRAGDQRNTMEKIPFPRIFSFILDWLSVHPLRLIFPLAAIISIVLRFLLGPNYTNMVLALFRWAL